MKFLLGLMVSITLMWGAQIDTYASKMGFERDYKTALEKAKAANKPLMLVIVGDYCPWCHKFERSTLNTKSIKPRLDSDVVTVIVDKKYDKTTFPEKFQTPIIPVVFFINPNDGNKFDEKLGYVKKKEFALVLDKVNTHFKGLK